MAAPVRFDALMIKQNSLEERLNTLEKEHPDNLSDIVKAEKKENSLLLSQFMKLTGEEDQQVTMGHVKTFMERQVVIGNKFEELDARVNTKSGTCFSINAEKNPF